MEAWADIRLRARAAHLEALKRTKGARDGRSLVAAALLDNDLELHRIPSEAEGGGVLGFLERRARVVNVAKGQEPEDEVVVIAHEIGHFRLHTDPSNEVTVVAAELGGDPVDSGAAKVDGYSARERKEVQADVFAGEFLCPSDWLRDELVTKHRKPKDIAGELGLPPSLVLHQAIRAVLLPPLREVALAENTAVTALDASQLEAATWEEGPLLVDAGPGTGKTRTLVHRIGHVLTKDTPGAILALTFSNKASEEMRVRVSATHEDAAIEMWVGTFHAFGMELITKWAGRVGRSADVRILDDEGSLGILEANLAKLPLKHFHNLYEPAFELVHVLRAISRCKDELITPDAYLAAAEAALRDAPPDNREDEERAVEIGKIYKVYQDALQEADAVDFGDLIMMAVQLLEENDDVRRDCQTRFRHILVDEYQDVNFASAKFLMTIAGDCRDVWVVADQRQSIYRFRGAKPTNVTRFPAEFTGKRRSLSTNYRSGGPVVRAFGTFSHQMSSDRGAAANWSADRGELGEVTLTVAPTVAGEAAAIRDQIEALRAQGIPYRDQVILARSHLTLSRITSVLEHLNVPLLYLGDLFERPEIRDLLSLVCIDAERGGLGLVRVAQFEEYGASKDDALKVIAWAQANDASILKALEDISEIDGLSESGRAALAKLASHLEGLDPAATPWTMLTTYLFERSAYLRPIIQKDSAEGQQQLIAIYQLLKVCGEALSSGNPTRKALLARIRRIEALNQDHAYRVISSEASDFDAVRVMTLHGSKGLEFRAVHLPAIATRYMPAGRQWDRCPPPAALAHLAMQEEDHHAEEECLFFVGLSRARDFLCLSRAERYTKTSASASKFLGTIAGHVRTRQAADLHLPSKPVVLTPPTPRAEYSERELDLYLRCPARYRYEAIDGLSGGSDGSPYVAFHRCVRRTMEWLDEEGKAGRSPTADAAQAELARHWEHQGPRGGFESYYRSVAQVTVAGLTQLHARETGQYDRNEWVVTIDGRRISITPDRVTVQPNGSVLVQRIKIGRKTKSESEHRIYALLRRAAAEKYPGRSISVETYYPGIDERVPATPKNDAKLLKQYSDAIQGIERGAFGVQPDEPRYCPNCPAYFICGA